MEIPPISSMQRAISQNGENFGQGLEGKKVCVSRIFVRRKKISFLLVKLWGVKPTAEKLCGPERKKFAEK